MKKLILVVCISRRLIKDLLNKECSLDHKSWVGIKGVCISKRLLLGYVLETYLVKAIEFTIKTFDGKYIQLQSCARGKTGNMESLTG